MTNPPSLPSHRRGISVRSLVFALVATIVLTSGFWNALFLWPKTPNTPLGPALGMRVDCPEKVKLGDSFDIKIVFRNAGQNELVLGTLCIDDSFLRGVTVVSITPASYARIDERWYVEYKFWKKIGAGQSDQYLFRVQANARGVFIGDVNAYDRSRRLASVTPQITVE
jgi:hypothetical protein